MPAADFAGDGFGCRGKGPHRLFYLARKLIDTTFNIQSHAAPCNDDRRLCSDGKALLQIGNDRLRVIQPA